MNRRTVKVALLAAILAAMGVGYVVSQVLWTHTLTGTVIVSSQPSIYVFDEDNKPVSVLDFGALTNGVHLTREIRLVNVGNIPLTVNVERTDTSTGILSAVKNQDGSPYEAVTLGMGENLYLTLELWNSVSLAAGQYPLAFKITGS